MIFRSSNLLSCRVLPGREESRDHRDPSVSRYGLTVHVYLSGNVCPNEGQMGSKIVLVCFRVCQDFQAHLETLVNLVWR